MNRRKLVSEPYGVAPTGRKGVAILQADDGCYYEMDAPRARRIAACVNACLNIPTRELERRFRDSKNVDDR